jgi:hypothetical protein
MSEYQYYEFLALDEPLTDKQLAEVRRFSSRARITPTSFVNEYNYGDFRGDVRTFMTKYYDVFVYVANWGTHRLCFRLLVGGPDVKAVKQYCRRDLNPRPPDPGTSCGLLAQPSGFAQTDGGVKQRES